MTDPKNKLGPQGEKRAERFLIKKGYTIAGKNKRVGGVEIDLLALKDDFLCLVEVKTRQSLDFGFPEEFVDQKKQVRLIRAAKLLSSRKAYLDLRIRFDIISVLYQGKTIEINHLENAFEEE